MTEAEVVPVEGDVILQSPWPWVSRPCSCLHGNNDPLLCSSLYGSEADSQPSKTMSRSNSSEGGTGAVTDGSAEAMKDAATDASADANRDTDLTKEDEEEEEDHVCPVHGRMGKNGDAQQGAMGQNRKKHRRNSHLIYLSMSSGVSKVSAVKRVVRSE